MGRLGALFSSPLRNRDINQNHKHISTPPRPVKTLKKELHHLSPIFRRRKDDFSQEASYDLGTFFMFRDDPDAPAETVASTDTSRPTTALSAREASVDQMIRFDFDPAVSFDLGISTLESIADENYEPPEPIFFRPDDAQSEVTHSLALGADIGFRQNSLERKFLQKRKQYTRRKQKRNPHNEYLANRFDADRIQLELELLDSPPENDIPSSLFIRRPLHERVEDNDEHEGISVDIHTEISKDLAVDEGTSVGSFSLKPGFKYEQTNWKQSAPKRDHLSKIDESPILPRLPNQAKRPKKKNTSSQPRKDRLTNDMKKSKARAEAGYDLVASKMEQDSQVYIPYQKEDSGVYIPKYSARKEELNQATQIFDEIQLSDDDLSVNNALAVNRFISAPRLCSGTKDLPYIIDVQSLDDGDHEFYIFANKSREDVDSVFRQYVSTEFDVPPQDSMGEFKKSSLPVNDAKSWKRVKSHMAQLPFVEQILSHESDGTLRGATIVGSKKSFASPVGIEQFDERRPWRKHTIELESSTVYKPRYSPKSKEEELINELKSRLQNIIEEVIPANMSVFHKVTPAQKKTDTSIVSLNPTVNEIKSRLRGIEATYSTDDANDSYVRSNYSVNELKARLRQIEANFSDNRGIQIAPIH